MRASSRPLAVAVQQLDLDVVERVEMGKRLRIEREERLASSSSLLAGDLEQRPTARLVFGADAPEDRVAQLHVAHQPRVAAGDREVALGEHHVHVRQQARKKPIPVHRLQGVQARRRG